MSEAPKRYQNRDDRNGQFTFDGNMPRVCVCGHTLGDHNACAPHECWIDTDPKHPLYPTGCQCKKVRLSRRKTALPPVKRGQA